MSDVAFDTETTGFDWYDGDRPFLSQAASQRRPAGVVELEGPAYELDGDADGPTPVMHELECASRVVGHNLPFDIHMARVGDIADLLRGRKLADTLHLARIVAPERRTYEKEHDDDPGHGYKLADLATTYVDPDAKDSEQAMLELAEKHGIKMKGKDADPQPYFELWKREPDAMERYGREDARLTYELLHALEPRLDDRTRRIWELEQDVMPYVVSAERRGVAVDQAKVPKLKADFTYEVDVLRDKLDTQLGEGWDDNNEQLAEALLKNGVNLTELTDTGKLATNKWALDRLKDDFPIVDDIQKYRLYKRFLNTYIAAVEGRDVVHPHFWQIGTWTGRMASSNPNMQNIPAHVGTQVRELFIPRPGFCFAALDYEQIEFRLMAYYLNDQGLINLMDSGHDPFAWLAARVHGGQAEQYVKGSAGVEYRQNAKNTTYAVQYGAGGKRIMRMLGLSTEAEGRAYAKQIKDSLPNYKRLTRRIEKQIYGPDLDRRLRSLPFGRPDWREQRERVIDEYIEETGRTYGVVNTIMGRRQTIPLHKAYTGLSGLIQGGAADIFKQGTINACEAVKHLGAEPVLFIHDELVFEVPLGAEQEVQRLAGEAMVAATDIHPVMATEGGIGYNNFAECK